MLRARTRKVKASTYYSPAEREGLYRGRDYDRDVDRQGLMAEWEIAARREDNTAIINKYEKLSGEITTGAQGAWKRYWTTLKLDDNNEGQATFTKVFKLESGWDNSLNQLESGDLAETARSVFKQRQFALHPLGVQFLLDGHANALLKTLSRDNEYAAFNSAKLELQALAKDAIAVVRDHLPRGRLLNGQELAFGARNFVGGLMALFENLEGQSSPLNDEFLNEIIVASRLTEVRMRGASPAFAPLIAYEFVRADENNDATDDMYVHAHYERIEDGEVLFDALESQKGVDTIEFDNFARSVLLQQLLASDSVQHFGEYRLVHGDAHSQNVMLEPVTDGSEVASFVDSRGVTFNIPLGVTQKRLFRYVDFGRSKIGLKQSMSNGGFAGQEQLVELSTLMLDNNELFDLRTLALDFLIHIYTYGREQGLENLLDLKDVLNYISVVLGIGEITAQDMFYVDGNANWFNSASLIEGTNKVTLGAFVGAVEGLIKSTEVVGVRGRFVRTIMQRTSGPSLHDLLLHPAFSLWAGDGASGTVVGRAWLSPDVDTASVSRDAQARRQARQEAERQQQQQQEAASPAKKAVLPSTPEQQRQQVQPQTPESLGSSIGLFGELASPGRTAEVLGTLGASPAVPRTTTAVETSKSTAAGFGIPNEEIGRTKATREHIDKLKEFMDAHGLDYEGLKKPEVSAKIIEYMEANTDIYTMFKKKKGSGSGAGAGSGSGSGAGAAPKLRMAKPKVGLVSELAADPGAAPPPPSSAFVTEATDKPLTSLLVFGNPPLTLSQLEKIRTDNLPLGTVPLSLVTRNFEDIPQTDYTDLVESASKSGAEKPFLAVVKVFTDSPDYNMDDVNPIGSLLEASATYAKENPDALLVEIYVFAVHDPDASTDETVDPFEQDLDFMQPQLSEEAQELWQREPTEWGDDRLYFDIQMQLQEST